MKSVGPFSIEIHRF